jgi:hypothetical protein
VYRICSSLFCQVVSVFFAALVSKRSKRMLARLLTGVAFSGIMSYRGYRSAFLLDPVMQIMPMCLGAPPFVCHRKQSLSLSGAQAALWVGVCHWGRCHLILLPSVGLSLCFPPRSDILASDCDVVRVLPVKVSRLLCFRTVSPSITRPCVVVIWFQLTTHEVQG